MADPSLRKEEWLRREPGGVDVAGKTELKKEKKGGVFVLLGSVV